MQVISDRKSEGFFSSASVAATTTPIGFQLWQCQVLWVIEARASLSLLHTSSSPTKLELF